MVNNFSISPCSQADFLEIHRDLSDFWGNDRTQPFHHPMFVNEFSDTSYVIHDDTRVIAYLFGFIGQKEPIGYVHLIGVRKEYQKQQIGKRLYLNFINVLQAKGIQELKAITTPSNLDSIRFHSKLGMEMLGEPLADGIKVIRDYSGPGQDRVVFRMIFKK